MISRADLEASLRALRDAACLLGGLLVGVLFGRRVTR